MRNIVKPCHRNRTPHRVVVQYRAEPYTVPGVRVARHYGPGVPIGYSWLNVPSYAPSGAAYAETVADMWRAADNGIDPDVITVAPSHGPL